jgi:hypothetical protein
MHVEPAGGEGVMPALRETPELRETVLKTLRTSNAIVDASYGNASMKEFAVAAANSGVMLTIRRASTLDLALTQEIAATGGQHVTFDFSD